jgi:hypothetical protein
MALFLQQPSKKSARQILMDISGKTCDLRFRKKNEHPSPRPNGTTKKGY